MSGRKIHLGTLGEQLAQRFLQKKGYEILESNFTCPLGEIDIIAKDGGFLCFIEVKTRTSTFFGLPIESIIKRKRIRLLRAAWFYIKRHRQSEGNFRFDVVSIMINEKCGMANVNIDKNVFGEDLR